jgi:flagellar P-ring protein precursor FlgI
MHGRFNHFSSWKTPMKPSITKLAVCVAILLGIIGQAHGVRIKDIADIKGVRTNQLVGYGLVVGLNGTGDSDDAIFTIQSFASMLERMGVTVKPDDIEVDNVAAVMVTADLPAFGRSGSRIDVLVSSIGDAENLQGGTLLFTPLKGADGQVYAIAQGPVSTGGFAAGSESGSGVQKNHPTAGRVINGAIIEKEIASDFNNRQSLTLNLHRADFTTASRVAQAINIAFYDEIASTQDAGTIEVKVPEKYTGNTVALVTMIERLGVTPDIVSKVVINERTGTVIMGENVRISTIAIAHGNLSIEIKENSNVSQPLPFSSGGQTVVTPESQVLIEEGSNPIFLVESGVSIGEVVKALNALGVTPRDLIAIFQALKAAGALQAELEII